MNINTNWKFLVVFYLFTFGLWGFLVKIVSTKLEWKTIVFYVWLALSVIYFTFIFKNVHLGFGKFHLLAFFAGIIAALGTMAFYKALSIAPASLVIPLSAQYILVTVLLCVIFLKEPLSLRIVAGIICSLTAIMLLSR